MSEAIRYKDYQRLEAILNYAYDQKILLHVGLIDVYYIVDNNEVQIMRALVKTLVLLRNDKGATA